MNGTHRIVLWGLRRLTLTGIISTVVLLLNVREAQTQIFEPPTFLPVTAPIPAGTRDISDVWWIDSYRPDFVPADGSEIPFTPEGRQIYEANVAGLKDGSIVDSSRKWCTPRGVPRILGMPYPFRIIQTPGQTTILYEMNHEFRVIYMNIPMPPDADVFPAFTGNAFGRWEEDTLIVETVGFKEQTYLDDTGLPHSDQLQITERLRKVNEGQNLEVVVTIEDPIIYTQPWDVRFSYERRPDIRLKTYACGEPHRDLSDVEGNVSLAEGAPQ